MGQVYSKEALAKRKAYSREWAENNKERLSVRRHERYANNREVSQIQSIAWQKANPERMQAWKTANTRHRRYVERLPLMSMAERAETEAMYEFCKLFPAYSVDHVIPLKGRKVSGLHVLSNLQIIFLDENRKKHAKFDPDAHEIAPVAIVMEPLCPSL